MRQRKRWRPRMPDWHLYASRTAFWILLTSGMLLSACGKKDDGAQSQLDSLQRTVTALELQALTPAATPSAVVQATPIPTAHICGLDEINAAKRSVVRLESNDGSGSGFLLSDGTIVTNGHVAGYATSLRVLFGDGSESTAAVYSLSTTHDLALLKPVRTPGRLGLDWGDSASLQDAQTVIAIGYPLGLSGDASVARGSVSRTVTVDNVEYIQTDTALNFGNSGGPLLDECGNVVGVVTFGIADAEGLGFAIAQRDAQPEIDRLTAAPSAPRVRSAVETVEQFLSLIHQKTYAEAYTLLSVRYQSGHPFATWMDGYRTTAGIELSGASEVSVEPRVVDVTYLAGDNINGQLLIRTYSERWTLTRQDGEWRMDSGRLLSVR